MVDVEFCKYCEHVYEDFVDKEGHESACKLAAVTKDLTAAMSIVEELAKVEPHRIMWQDEDGNFGCVCGAQAETPEDCDDGYSLVEHDQLCAWKRARDWIAQRKTEVSRP